jgi:FtsZ-interacting cell division protein YlmF
MEFLKKLADKVTFKDDGSAAYEPEYLEEEQNNRETRNTSSSMLHDDEHGLSFGETKNSMRVVGGTRRPHSKLRFYKLKGQDWLELVKRMTADFKSGSAVLINIEEANKDTVTRVKDFMCGVAFSHEGRVLNHGATTFVALPSNCDGSGDDIGGDIYDNITGFGGDSYE